MLKYNFESNSQLNLEPLRQNHSWELYAKVQSNSQRKVAVSFISNCWELYAKVQF